MVAEAPKFELTAPPYALSSPDVLAAYQSDANQGLTPEEVRARQELFGFNELKQAPGTPLWLKFVGQFKDLVIWILIVAALAAGKATAVVVATGMSTELGHIARMLGQEEREPTPLQRRLAELGKVLIIVLQEQGGPRGTGGMVSEAPGAAAGAVGRRRAEVA